MSFLDSLFGGGSPDYAAASGASGPPEPMATTGGGFWDAMGKMATSNNPMLEEEPFKSMPTWAKILGSAKFGVSKGGNWFGMNMQGGGQNAMMGQLMDMLKKQGSQAPARNPVTVTPLENRAERAAPIPIPSGPIPDVFGQYNMDPSNMTRF